MKSAGRVGSTTMSHTVGKRTAPSVGADAQGVAGATLERIRMRAYEIFLGRKGAPGDPVTDWLQAERELRAGIAGRAAVPKQLEVKIPRGEVLLRDDE